MTRLEAFGPDLIFNTAEGRRGRFREAFFPALFDELGMPYTGPDAYALSLTLDKPEDLAGLDGVAANGARNGMMILPNALAPMLANVFGLISPDALTTDAKSVRATLPVWTAMTFLRL